MVLQKVPWNVFSGKLEVPLNSMELGRMEKVPWDSMELWIWTNFHGIPWMFRLVWLSSMEFHGTINIVQMLFQRFHVTVEEVPWNYFSSKLVSTSFEK